MPVHTIVWAKELYKLLFHEKPELSMLYENPSLDNNNNGEDDDENNASNNNKSSTYMSIVLDQKPFKQNTSTDARSYALAVIDALFHKEIQKQLDMDRYKTAKKKPIPLDAETLNATTTTPIPSSETGTVWSPAQCVAQLVSCIVEAYSSDPPPSGEFDKDDDHAMLFVTAASNLRSHQFGIDMQSFYETKGIAGNIIPAIATTNAIVAGLQILQVFQILKLQEQEHNNNNNARRIKECCRYVYCLRDKTRKGYYLQPTTLADPNPKCFVCRNAQVDVCIDTQTWMLKDFVDLVIKKRLGFSEPSILIGDSQVYEEGEDEALFAMNLSKTLVNLPCGGIKDGSVIRVDDFSQELEVDLCIVHKADWDEKDVDHFTIGGEVPMATTDENEAAEDESQDEKKEDENDAVVIESDQVFSTKKRILLEDDEEASRKKVKST